MIKKLPLQAQLFFRDNSLGTDLAEMQLISKFNKGFGFFYVLLIYSVNMHGLIPLKDRKEFKNAF